MTVNNLGLAIQIAASVHINQLDKGGKPYILHPMRVMMRLRTNDSELMQIAILHDVIEDSRGEYTIEILRGLGFSKRVLDALTLLTHDPAVPYELYIEDIAKSLDTILVKMEDLRDNSDITRLKGLREKDHARLAKYCRAYDVLQTALALYRV